MKKMIIIAGALLFGLQSLGETPKEPKEEDTVNICYRIPQVQRAIQKQVEEESCDKIPLKKMMAIKILNLSSSGIRSLVHSDLAGLPNLRVLNLQNNKLSDLEYDIFAFNKFPNLKKINLRGNNLRSLDGRVFAELPNLKKVYLDKDLYFLLPNEIREALSHQDKPFDLDFDFDFDVYLSLIKN